MHVIKREIRVHLTPVYLPAKLELFYMTIIQGVVTTACYTNARLVTFVLGSNILLYTLDAV